MKILIVEDEKPLAESVKALLEKQGFEADCVYDGLSGVEHARLGVYDLLILDVMLPGMDGRQVAKLVRSGRCGTPILMLTALSGVDDRIAGLDAGADDYIAKPFSVLELLSRIRAVLRRTSRGAAPLTCGPVTLDPLSRAVSCQGRPVELTYKEFELLHYMLRHPGEALSRTRLLEKVWGFDFEGESRTVDMHVKTLRRKLGAGGGLVKTVRGAGYKLEE